MERNWAIVIGIDTYDNLQPLNYAHRDAAAIRDYFLNEVGFEKVFYFAEDAPDIEVDYGPPFKPLPTFAKLDRFLDIRFEQGFLGVGDNFWFFFAGHGKRHQGRDYLLPSDVNPRNIEGTAIPINYITERLCRCGADNVILLLDACRNEGDRDGEGFGSERQKGVVTLFSCSPNERSYEIDELQHGAFTYTLLQGLRMQGEGNCATVERLDQYLRYRVPELNRRYRKPQQTPYTNAEPIAKRHLILLPRKAMLADVVMLKNDALEAEAERNWELAEQFWTRVLIVSPGDAQAIRAIKRIARQAGMDLPLLEDPPPPSISDCSGSVHLLPRSSHSLPTTSKLGNEYEQAQAAYLLGKYDESLTIIDRLFEHYPTDPKVCLLKGHIYYGLQRFDIAKELYQSVLNLTTDSDCLKHANQGLAHIDELATQSFAEQGSFEEENAKYAFTTVDVNSVSTLPTFLFEMITVNKQGREVNRCCSEVQYFTEDLGNGVVLEMISIPGGTFQMGSIDGEGDNDERPQHAVTVKPFLMGEYVVTQAQWRRVADLPKVDRDLNLDPSSFKGDIRPVEQVSWLDVMEFCVRLSEKTGRKYGLPSEAQWEYACRAGTITPFYFGETITTDLVNCDGNDTYASEPKGKYREQTTNVGSFPPNAFGLYDMHGNVWEWCLDYWHNNYQDAPRDGSAWMIGGNSNYRLLRGGSWNHTPSNCRSASRTGINPECKLNHIGFRIVCGSA